MRGRPASEMIGVGDDAGAGIALRDLVHLGDDRYEVMAQDCPAETQEQPGEQQRGDDPLVVPGLIKPVQRYRKAEFDRGRKNVPRPPSRTVERNVVVFKGLQATSGYREPVQRDRVRAGQDGSEGGIGNDTMTRRQP